MKLLLRRDQRQGLLGKVIFTLDVRADISDAERANIKKYKLGKELLYARNKDVPQDEGWKGVGKMLVFHALNITISVNDLVDGKQIECKDIMEMLAAEEQIKTAALNFGRVLEAATRFGGEEVVHLGADENPAVA
jgi:predicted GNAT family acetyltransferase